MSRADIRWAGGPLVHARPEGPFAMGEAVSVGDRELLGEVIRVARDKIVAQVYGDTTGLRPGDRIEGTGRPLSVKLGPHLLGNIFDGLLQPLAQGEDDVTRYRFEPLVAANDHVVAGMRLAKTGTSERPEWCLLPPHLSGTVEKIVAVSDVALNETICQVRDDHDVLHDISLTQTWPVRRPRPVASRLPADRPMITGQRILDTLFPVARGGRAAIPGGFGTGKTVLQETFARWCDADIIIYVGCGERGNEMAGVLDEFPKLTDPRTGRPLMERTIIIANTSNMPVAAREASIYTAVTVGEYFRDQGFHVALMADSTSRWAEALREVSGRLGELPAEAGYPAYLGSRLAEFYERAARVQTLSGEEGSLTIIGAVSPPAGDFSEPVTSHTKRYVRCFWALDRERAQARFYPAIHPLQSYSGDAGQFAGWWASNGNADWSAQRRRLLHLLEQQAGLERMARIVGKDALPPAQQLLLNAAELVNEAILRQSAFSPVDRYCSPARQARMVKIVVRVIELSEQALAAGENPEAIADLPVMHLLKRLGEEIGEDHLEDFDALERRVESEFAALMKHEAAAS